MIFYLLSFLLFELGVAFTRQVLHLHIILDNTEIEVLQGLQSAMEMEIQSSWNVFSLQLHLYLCCKLTSLQRALQAGLGLGVTTSVRSRVEEILLPLEIGILLYRGKYSLLLIVLSNQVNTIFSQQHILKPFKKTCSLTTSFSAHRENNFQYFISSVKIL